MADFNFTATAQCDYCGELLSSSDEDCDNCSQKMVDQHVFRRISSDEDAPDIIMVEATRRYKWYKLEQELGDDWIGYEWLGPRWSVQNKVASEFWGSIQDIPRRTMSLDAPSDVGTDAE